MIKFNVSFSEWKNCVKEIKTKLKYRITSEQDCMLNSLNKMFEILVQSYDDLKSKKFPTNSETDKAYCVTHVTQDMNEVMQKNQTALFNSIFPKVGRLGTPYG